MKYIKILLSILILIVSILISLGSMFLFKLNKGFYEGYLNSEVNLNISDIICFYSNTGILELIKISKEGHKIKSLNFSKESLENTWKFVSSLNKLRKGIQHCISNIEYTLNEKREDTKVVLDQLKKYGKKLLEFIPLGDHVNKGIASIELALQFKYLIGEIDKLNNFDSLSDIIILYSEYKNISKSIGKLTKLLEDFFKIEDLKLIESIISILSNMNEDD